MNSGASCSSSKPSMKHSTPIFFKTGIYIAVIFLIIVCTLWLSSTARFYSAAVVFGIPTASDSEHADKITFKALTALKDKPEFSNIQVHNSPGSRSLLRTKPTLIFSPATDPTIQERLILLLRDCLTSSDLPIRVRFEGSPIKITHETKGGPTIHFYEAIGPIREEIIR